MRTALFLSELFTISDSKKVTARSITIAADTIKFVRSARLRYEQFQPETSKEEKAAEKQLKRKLQTSSKRLSKKK